MSLCYKFARWRQHMWCGVLLTIKLLYLINVAFYYRNNTATPEQKLLITLRHYATGSFRAVCGDFVGVHKSTASQIIRLVYHELALLRPKFINFPSTSAGIDTVVKKCLKFPKCIGAIDCTHVKIISLGRLD